VKKVTIIGSSGSGKSTLAARLGQALGLPVYHLDRLFWQPGWQETPRDEWRALQEQICAEPAWILDGNYSGTLDIRLAACDTVVWLDLPTAVCLTSTLWRILRYRGRTRPDMGEGCPEQFDWAFLQWIGSFRKQRRPGIVQKLGELPASTEVVVLTSRREMARWLEGVQKDARRETTRCLEGMREDTCQV
jgi:adenylate kinase family enzyme